MLSARRYTTDERAELLAMGVAPVVVHAVGYPSSMASSFVPYVLLDRYAMPPRARDAFSERMVLQPHCYQANDHRRTPPPLPSSSSSSSSSESDASIGTLSALSTKSATAWLVLF